MRNLTLVFAGVHVVDSAEIQPDGEQGMIALLEVAALAFRNGGFA